MIVPVLDIMLGQVVLAEGGDRAAYRPVHSRLTNSSRPLDVAQAIFNQTGCDWLYLADIDSFAGAMPNWSVYRSLLERGFGLWVDADWVTQDRFAQINSQLGDHERFKMIVSSETLATVDQLTTVAELKSKGIEVIFSLDKKGESVILQTGELVGTRPLEFIHMAWEQGVRDLIVLDLSEVGTRNGYRDDASAPTLIEEIRSEHPDAVLTSGGGVRGADDIQRWIDAGCDHVLVASAIHDCVLTPDDVSRFR